MTNLIHFDISEVVSLADRPLHVKLKGLSPHQSVTIRLTRPTINPNLMLDSQVPAVQQVNLVGGGDMYANVQASADSWKHMLQFLSQESKVLQSESFWPN